MGFYGNINNTVKVQFSFDRIFSSRSAMVEAVNNGTDAVFAGRFVLVSYDKEVHTFPLYFWKQNKIYKALSDARSAQNEILPTSLSRGSVIQVPLNYNLDRVEAIDNYDRIIPKAIEANLNNYYLDSAKLDLYKIIDKGEVEPPEPRYVAELVSNHEIAQNTLYYFINENNELELIAENNVDNPYLINYLLDTRSFGAGRGYDGTVWQKMYSENRPYYAMVAELNSIVPTLAITADAPTVVPKAPHFDVDTSNVYYKLHVQSVPGLWLKPAVQDSEITAGTDRYDTTTNSIQTASINYPSDLKYYYPRRQSDGTVKHEAAARDAAMYFNKAGFDPKVITYAADAAEGDDGTQKNVWTYLEQENKYLPEDLITIDLNGKSGQLYGVEGSVNQTAQPDTNEVVVMLPSIGDTMAHVWDLVYGGRDVLGQQALTRNLDISWEDAGNSQTRAGLRLTKEAHSGIGYMQDEVNTVAGSINTMHDLIGMIIVDATDIEADFDRNDLPATKIAAKDADVDKIYWKNEKYYRVGIEYDPQDYDDSSINTNRFPHFVQTRLNEPLANTYFDKYGQNYLLVRNTSDFKKNKTYYYWPGKLSDAFTAADVPEAGYVKDTYYYIENGDYVVDQNELPTSGRQYYEIPRTSWQSVADQKSIIWFATNRFYRLKKVPVPNTNPIEYIYTGEVELDSNSQWSEQPGTLHYDLYLAENRTSSGDTVYVNVTDRVRMFRANTYYTWDEAGKAYRLVKEDIYRNIWSDDVNDEGEEGRADGHTIEDIQNITLKLYTLAQNTQISLYAPGTYYYVANPIETNDPNNSLTIKVSADSDETIQVIGDIVKDKSYIKDPNRTYFIKETEATQKEDTFYIPNEYYVRDNEDGTVKGDDDNKYTLSSGDFSNITYFERFNKAVYEDTNNVFPQFSEWNSSIDVPEDVTLCWLKDRHVFEELEGYARDKNTLNGLLLETHKLFGAEDTRDLNTVHGAINSIHDLTNNFATMQAGQNVLVDHYGRLHSGPVKGDYWIDIDLDDDITEPSLTITHNEYSVTPTTSTASLSNVSAAATFPVPTYSFDGAGHYNGLDTKTYTLPNSYGIITGDNAGVSAEASASHDTLAINGDSWLTSTITTDTVTITHNAPQTAQPITLTETSANNVTPAFGATFDIADWTFDSKGHMAGGTKHTVTIPDLGVTDIIANGNVLTGLSYTNGSGTFTTARANLGNIALGAYEAPASGGSGNITTTTTLAQAIAALDGRIGTSISNLTYAGESEPAANSFVTEVTQTNGVISVTKSIIPLSNIAESTTPQLVSYNNQGIVTGGSALTWDTMKNLEVGRDNNEAIITFDNLVRYLLQLHETALTKTLTSIAVTTLPNVVTYTDGDRLSLTGMRITGTYTQGADTTYELIETGYTVSPEGNTELSVNGSSTPVTVPVTVTYQGKTATFNITVNPKVMTGIEITQEPTTMNYTDRKTLDLDGLVVTASFNDNSTRPLNTNEYVTDPVEGATLTSGDVTVLVSVPNTEFTDSFTVHVE